MGTRTAPTAQAKSMTTPAALLRQLDERLTAGPWRRWEPPLWDIDDEPEAQDIATLRNLVPQLVTLLESVAAEADYIRTREGVPGDVRAGVSSRLDAVLSALTEKLEHE